MEGSFFGELNTPKAGTAPGSPTQIIETNVESLISLSVLYGGKAGNVG